MCQRCCYVRVPWGARGEAAGSPALPCARSWSSSLGAPGPGRRHRAGTGTERTGRAWSRVQAECSGVQTDTKDEEMSRERTVVLTKDPKESATFRTWSSVPLHRGAVPSDFREHLWKEAAQLLRRLAGSSPRGRGGPHCQGCVLVTAGTLTGSEKGTKNPGAPSNQVRAVLPNTYRTAQMVLVVENQRWRSCYRTEDQGHVM